MQTIIFACKNDIAFWNIDLLDRDQVDDDHGEEGTRDQGEVPATVDLVVNISASPDYILKQWFLTFSSPPFNKKIIWNVLEMGIPISYF